MWSWHSDRVSPTTLLSSHFSSPTSHGFLSPTLQVFLFLGHYRARLPFFGALSRLLVFLLSPEVGAYPCGVAYHTSCIQAGPNFTCHWRHKADSGSLLIYGNGPSSMRPLDLLHSCSLGTHKVYQQKLQILRRFEGSLGVSVLRTKPLARPPSGPNITVMWAQEHYSLRSRGERKGQLHDATLAFATIR